MEPVARGPKEEYTREAGVGMEETVYVMGGEHCRPFFLDEEGGEESDATSCTDDGGDCGEDIQQQIDRLDAIDAGISRIESLMDPSVRGGETEVLLGGEAQQPLGSRIFGRRRQSPRVRGVVVGERPRAGDPGEDGDADRGGLCGRSVRPHLVMVGLAAVLLGVAAALQVMQFYKWELRGVAGALVADIPPRGVMEIKSKILKDTDYLGGVQDRVRWW